MPEPSTRRPLIDPLLLALRSRRVVIALCTLAVGVLILALPVLEPLRDELLTLLTALALALIGGYSLEDAAHAARQRAPTPAPDDLRDTVQEIVLALLDELSDPTRRAPETEAETETQDWE